MWEIIDFHTHPFLNIADSICKHQAYTPQSAELTPEDLRGVGITRFCGSVICRRTEGFDEADGFAQLRCANADAWKLAEDYGGIYLPGVQIHPDFVEESCAALDETYRRGNRLVGELVPQSYGWNYAHEGLEAIVAHAAKYRMVFSLHTVTDYGMENLIAAYPDVTFVFAHPGELKTLEWHIERMKRYENLYLDLSGTGLFRYGMLRHLVATVGADRILFGTDYPVCNPGMYVGGVLAERLTDDEKEKIFSGNAKRLLGLS